MRKPIPLILVAILGLAGAFAQEVTVTTPVTRPAEAKYVMDTLTITQSAIWMLVSVQDSGGVEIRKAAFQIPDSTHPGATVVGFMTALDTVRAAETGGQLRKMNFRAMGYLFDQGFFPGTTVAP